MALKDDVQAFLNDFKAKTRTFGIVYYPRQKNTDAMLRLGINAEIREELNVCHFIRQQIQLNIH